MSRAQTLGRERERIRDRDQCSTWHACYCGGMHLPNTPSAEHRKSDCHDFPLFNRVRVVFLAA
jgi:hypothetical protein